VAMGHIREQDFERKIASVLAALHLEAQRTPVAVAYGHPASRNPRYRTPKELARRKPRGGMIRELVAQYPEAAAEGVLFVGDRDQDRDAALDAGVDFQWAEEYF